MKKLRLIYGCPGSEKSAYMHRLIADSLKKGKKAILIVPERFSVTAEQEVTRLCGDENKMNLDILSFKRLCNRVFREYGGLSSNYAGKGSRLLMMWRALCAVKENLKAYRHVALRDSGTIEAMLDSVVSIKRAAISPEDLEKAAEKCADKPALQNKLRDLAKISESYERLLTERYDDPEEDLARLDRILTDPSSDPSFFADKEVYIDSTAAFTGQELNIVKRALAQSPVVTVCFEYLPEDDRPMLDKLRWCDSLVRKAAEEAGIGRPEELRFPDAPRKKKDLAALEKRLFSENETPFCDSERSMHTDLSEDLYEECKRVAARIQRDVQENKEHRFYDHCVVARDLSEYAGVIDRVFEVNGIPYTMTAGQPLSARGACRLILTALRLIVRNFRCDDVLAYLMTGYSGIDEETCWLLEDYLNLWRPEGKRRWLQGGDFVMNPDGHTPKRSDQGDKDLARINEAKKILTSPLSQLESDCPASAKAETYATAIYDFMLNMKLPEAIERERAACKAAGDNQQELYHEQTWKALCALLDDLVSGLADSEVRFEDFARMFEMLSEQKRLASIPPGKDRVLITDAFNLKPGEIRVLHAVGMNEGVFPAPVSFSGMFSRRERNALKKIDLELPGNDERAAFDEEYLCYSVLTLPYEKLYVSCRARDLDGTPCKPSDLFTMLEKFYGDKNKEKEKDKDKDKEKEKEKEKEDLLYGRGNCLEAAFAPERSKTSSALRACFAREEENFRKKTEAAPLVADKDELSKESVAAVYPDESPVMSQTKLETFAGCPLSYTCKYILNLKEKPKEEAGDNEIGTIVHEVLEHLIDRCIDSGGSVGALTNKELRERVDEELALLRKKMIGNEESTAVDQLFRRIAQSLYVIAENLRDEFAESSFQPVYCELEFGKQSKKENGLSLPGEKTKGEFSLTIIGTVDRVDAFTKDGKTYLRVVDYKTYSKDFKESELEKGKYLQMPLYLRALLKTDNSQFLSKIGAVPGGELLPAAILYHNVGLPKADVPEGEINKEAVEEAVRKSIVRAGLLLDDEAIRKAMGGMLTDKPAKPVTEEHFMEILDRLDEILSGIARRMRSGDATAILDTKTCRYCSMRPICRKNEQDNRDGEDGENGEKRDRNDS